MTCPFQLDLEFCEKSLSAAASLRVLKVIQEFHHSNGLILANRLEFENRVFGKQAWDSDWFRT